MNRRIVFAGVIAVALLAAGCGAMNQPMTATGTKAMPHMPSMASDGALLGPTGMTLYTFDKDVVGSGKSMCNGDCAKNWPPLAAPESAKAIGDWSVIVRDDGTRQYAFKGKPVYHWIKDQKPGDRTGDGFNNVWHVAKP